MTDMKYLLILIFVISVLSPVYAETRFNELFESEQSDFLDIADRITIYTNANDTALNWALRFFGWPRLGAPGELGLTPEDLQSLKDLENTIIVDVAEAENTASGNGHGYFIKSPWVSSDILLTLRYGLKGPERGLFQRKGTPDWRFHSMYPVRLKQLSENLNEGR